MNEEFFNWNELIKESIEIINPSILNEDTDELDDADLPVGIKPKEYHKQKSKMRSLQQRIINIVNDVNSITNSNISEEILKLSKKMNKQNRNHWTSDNKGDDWLRSNRKVTRKALEEAWEDGYRMHHSISGSSPDHSEALSRYYEQYHEKFRKLWLPKALELINGNSIKVYRGLIIDKEEKNFLIGLKYNLQERNSWSYDKRVAYRYMDEGEWKSSNYIMTFILEMNCKLSDTNLLFSAWAEGYWCGYGANIDGTANGEINLKKNLMITSIKVKPMNKCAKKWYKEV